MPTVPGVVGDRGDVSWPTVQSAPFFRATPGVGEDLGAGWLRKAPLEVKTTVNSDNIPGCVRKASDLKGDFWETGRERGSEETGSYFDHVDQIAREGRRG